MAGLRGRIASGKTQYAVGEFPKLTFQMENVGGGDDRIQDQPWFGGSPAGATLLAAPDGQTYPLRVRLGAGRPKHILAPGGTESGELRLENAAVSVMHHGNYADFLLWALSQHGEFTVHFVYGDLSARVTSNRLTFKVEPPPDDAPWSHAVKGLRLLTTVSTTDSYEFLVTSFWNVGERPIAVHTTCVGWELTDAARRKHTYTPLRALHEFVNRRAREADEALGPLMYRDQWRAIPPKGKASTLHALSAREEGKAKRLGWRWFGTEPYAFTSVDPTQAPKPWTVASVYFYDPAIAEPLLSVGAGRQHSGLDDRAWAGQIVGNKVVVPRR